jgi:hypothetical protein
MHAYAMKHEIVEYSQELKKYARLAEYRDFAEKAEKTIDRLETHVNAIDSSVKQTVKE